ncbi:MAG TPA: hypothetical protein VFW53_09510 [Gallionella sp.]|nr:hypothetical protein [Gallionella sp.]
MAFLFFALIFIITKQKNAWLAFQSSQIWRLTCNWEGILGFAYTKKRAQEISKNGTGSLAWKKPITDAEYEAQRRYSNSDISIEQVMFSEPEAKVISNEPRKI